MAPAPRYVALACLVVAVVAGVVAPAAAAPPPRPVCDACGDTFEATARSHGADVAVEHSTATVTVHGDGSATWVVRNRLADAGDAERLRANESRLAAIGDRAMWDATFLGATVDDGVVALRYREDGFAERSAGGTLRSAVFTEAYGYRNLDGLGADRLTVVAPEGTRVGWAVPGATVSGNGRRMTLTELDRHGVVTFVPRERHLGPVWSLVAVGTLVGPTLAVNAVVGVVLPASVFGLVVAGLAGVVSRLKARRRGGLDPVGERAAAGLVASGTLAVLAALGAAAGAPLRGTAAAPAAGVGLVLVAGGAALSRPVVRNAVSTGTLAAGTAVAVAVAAGATVAAGAAFHSGGPLRASLTAVPFVLPLFGSLPAGYALGEGRQRLAVATVTTCFALALVPSASLFAPSTGGAVLGVAAAYSAATVVLGTPLFLVGAALAGDERDRPAAE